MRSAKIFKNDIFCGILSEDEEGYHFIYNENEYVLAPSYDLLAVLLVDPDDTDELAMALEVGGKKTGFDRDSFMRSIIDSGIAEKTGDKIIEKMISNKQKWFDILDSSFLPEDMIAAYKQLIAKRIECMIPNSGS